MLECLAQAQNWMTVEKDQGQVGKKTGKFYILEKINVFREFILAATLYIVRGYVI